MSGVTRVHIVETGVANIASMLAAFRRLGAEPVLTSEPEAVDGAECVVLPGVGSFGAGMETLRADGLVDPLVDRIEADRPTLAVCLGMQLLCASSEESSDARGLDIVPVEVRRFSDEVRIPQYGWNEVEAAEDSRYLSSGYAYFANSYRIADVPDGWTAATADYGGAFVAAMERGAILACQFHPEISGQWGLGVMRNWLETGGV